MTNKESIMSINGIFSLVILLADIFAIIKIAKSSETTLMKVIWIAVVVILPIIGLIVWFLAGPGDKTLKL